MEQLEWPLERVITLYTPLEHRPPTVGEVSLIAEHLEFNTGVQNQIDTTLALQADLMRSLIIKGYLPEYCFRRRAQTHNEWTEGKNSKTHHPLIKTYMFCFLEELFEYKQSVERMEPQWHQLLELMDCLHFLLEILQLSGINTQEDVITLAFNHIPGLSKMEDDKINAMVYNLYMKSNIEDFVWAITSASHKLKGNPWRETPAELFPNGYLQELCLTLLGFFVFIEKTNRTELPIVTLYYIKNQLNHIRLNKKR